MEKKRILLVDDEERTRSIYAEVLREAGFEVEEAEDGLAGLEKVNHQAPDLIMTGISMPRMDGFTLTEMLKKNVAFSGIPLLILSHQGREDDKVRAEALGVDDFILRDMTSPKEIVAKIQLFFTSRDYVVNVAAGDLDAPALASDFGLNTDFRSPADGKKYALRLRLVDKEKKHFTAELASL